jgi:hypothetical protein
MSLGRLARTATFSRQVCGSSVVPLGGAGGGYEITPVEVTTKAKLLEAYIARVTVRGSAALAALTANLVDYAGLFPPAALEMDAAVAAYARYLRDPHRAILGRFVVPVARLQELANSAVSAWAESGEPWQLAALAGSDRAGDARCIAEFNERYRGRALVDAVEVKGATAGDIAASVSVLAPAASASRVYVEIPVDRDPAPLVAAIAQSGVSAKIRTGGVTADAFPSAVEIVRFIEACRDHGVAFKATAGLHHPLRGRYALTYEPNSPSGWMHGFVNLFLTAAFVRAGLGTREAIALMEEQARDAFLFDDAGVTWRDHAVTIERLRDSRENFAHAFGSCSFREPVDDLSALGML